MSFNFVTRKNVAVGGLSFTENLTINDETLVAGAPLAAGIPAAQPAVLTVHTDSTHGTLTMTNTSHGIITGQRIDLYWAAGQTYDVTVGTVSGVSVPITLSTGALPIATTPIVVGIPKQVTLPVVGNNLSALVMSAPNGADAQFTFASVAPADLANIYLIAGAVWEWFAGSGNANPLAGVTATTVWVSHDNVTGPVTTLQVAALTH